jgi:hypothetical protein
MRSHGKPKHCDSIDVCCVGSVGFERLLGRGDKPDFVQSGLLETAPCQEEVSPMHRIETAAEDAKSHEIAAVAQGLNA